MNANIDKVEDDVGVQRKQSQSAGNTRQGLSKHARRSCARSGENAMQVTG